MTELKSLSQMAEHVRSSGNRIRIAVAAADDLHTLESVNRAVSQGFATAILVGAKQRIQELCRQENLDCTDWELIDQPDPEAAVKTAVRLAREDQADAVMKGLVSTDRFLREIIHKERGLLIPKAVMSHVCVIEVPRYHKLLFISDTAVLPFPDLDQKVAMVNYAVSVARGFGIQIPKVALITATEKVIGAMPNTLEYAMIAKMAERGQIKNCVIDGPLDIFLACDPAAGAVKAVDSPIAGDADVLIFPNLETSNTFYKGLMLFAGGELAGLIQGTQKPVIVMSRNESALSKYYSIAAACQMAGGS